MPIHTKGKLSKKGIVVALNDRIVWRTFCLEQCFGATVQFNNLYEHKNFNPDGGRDRMISVNDYAPQSKHSLHTQDFKDCLSSLKWKSGGWNRCRILRTS